MEDAAKFKRMDQTVRIKYDKPSNLYSNKVLIGPWVERRFSYQYENLVNTTTYQDHYDPKPYSRVDPNLMWDLKIKAEDSNFISQIGKTDFPNYFQNFASTYDLAYNHFPPCLRSHLPRKLRFRIDRYEPVEEYLPSFGNITKYGLVEHLQEKWKCDVQDPRITYSTSYRVDFPAPSSDSYQWKRHAIPLPNSSIMLPANSQNLDLQLRNQPMCTVPFSADLVMVPREKRPNPITWEEMC